MKKRYWLLSPFFLLIFYLIQPFFLSDQNVILFNQAIKIGMKEEPLTLDPRKNSDGSTSTFLSFLHEGLVKKDAAGEISMALAQAVEISPCQKEYTFTLKKAYWSDGLPILAKDFVECWKQALEPSLGAYNPEYFFLIKNAKNYYEGREKKFSNVGIKALSENRLKIILEFPTSSFLELLTNKSFYLVHKDLSEKKILSLKELKISGPFLIKSWVNHDKIVLEKNLHYWDHSSIVLQNIEFVIIHDEHTQICLFQDNQLDWIGAPFSFLPIDSMRYLTENYPVHFFSSSSLFFFVFNESTFPLTHPKIRKALSFAINRSELCEHLFIGNDPPACSLIPPKMRGGDLNYFQDADEVQAQRLFSEGLKELGLSKENFPKLTLTYPAFQSRRLVAQAIQQQWFKTLGIQIELQSKEYKLYLEDLNQRKFDICAMARGTTQKDPYYFLSLFKPSSHLGKILGWESSEFESLLAQSQQVNQIENKYALVRKAEEIFMKQTLIIPLFFPSQCFLKKSHLQGVVLHDEGVIDFNKSYINKL